MMILLLAFSFCACGEKEVDLDTAVGGRTARLFGEVLNAESWKHVVPAYYDTALKFKGTRDAESIAMLDLIVDSRVFDMGYIYSSGMGPGFMLQKLFANDDTNIESFLAANASAFEKHYEKVFASFDNE